MFSFILEYMCILLEMFSFILEYMCILLQLKFIACDGFGISNTLAIERNSFTLYDDWFYVWDYRRAFSSKFRISVRRLA